MAMSRRLLTLVAGLCTALLLVNEGSITVEAGNYTYLDTLNSGVAAMLDLNTANETVIIDATEKELTQNAAQAAQETNLVMVNVKSTLNVRAEASEDAKKVGKIYKDCGGTVLEQSN